MIISLIRPILFTWLKSDQTKRLIIDLLTKLAEQTDNDVDDKAVEFIRNGLFPGE
jgi:type IV secretory pathway VirB4 component